jgi:hypothetical protein
MRPLRFLATVAAMLAVSGSARAGGIELEARGGSLTQTFRKYRFDNVRVVDWASFVTVDASVFYWVPYFYVGASAGFGASVAQSYEANASAKSSVDEFVRLYSASIEIGAHLRTGDWTFRPGLALGAHHAVVSTGSVACSERGNPSAPIAPCDETRAADVLFVQPGISADVMVSEHTYVGARIGLDIPLAGPVIAFVIGFRTPGESEPTTARTARSHDR